MGIFGKRWKKEDYDVTGLETRKQIHEKTNELLKETTNELIDDVRDFMIREDLISDKFAEYIPTIKKYGDRLNALWDLSNRSYEIELKKMEQLEEQNEKVSKSIDDISVDMRVLSKEIEKQNEILGRIAKALEAKNK